MKSASAAEANCVETFKKCKFFRSALNLMDYGKGLPGTWTGTSRRPNIDTDSDTVENGEIPQLISIISIINCRRKNPTEFTINPDIIVCNLQYAIKVSKHADHID